jgi:hypothetical protein
MVKKGDMRYLNPEKDGELWVYSVDPQLTKCVDSTHLNVHNWKACTEKIGARYMN